MPLRSLSGDIYSCFSSYLAKDVEAARVKIEGFNKHVKQLQEAGALGATLLVNNPSVMKHISGLLSVGGWGALVALCFLLMGGTFWYYGSIGALVVSCPALAIAMAAAGGITVKIIWDNKDVVLIIRNIGEAYKPKHEALYKTTQNSGVLGEGYLAIDRLHEELTNKLVETLINRHYEVLNYTAVMKAL